MSNYVLMQIRLFFCEILVVHLICSTYEFVVIIILGLCLKKLTGFNHIILLSIFDGGLI